ncbi:MAG TPA: AMP-binding protein [bacterium]|nr:AMP-binding protein [bacterium]
MGIEKRKLGLKTALDYPNKTLHDLLVENASKFKRKDAIYYGGTEYSWQYIDAFSNGFANVLTEMGISRGSRIAVLLPNIPQFIMTVFGVWKAGCAVLLLDPWLGEKELQARLASSDARIVVALRDIVFGYDTYYKIQAIRDSTRIEHVITTSMTDAWSSLTSMFGVLKDIKPKKRENTIDWLSTTRKKLGRKPPEVSSYPDDVAVLHYIGALSSLRQIELSHRNLVVNSLQYSSRLKVEENDVVLGLPPLWLPYMLVSAFTSTLFSGAKTVLIPLITSYSLKLMGERLPDFIEALRKHKVTVIPGSPSLFQAFVALADERDLFKTVRAAICLPAPPPDEVKSAFQRISGIKIVSGYATPEGLITHLEELGLGSKPGSIGQTLPDTEAAIFNIEDKDLPVEVNQVGLLGVRGPQFDGIYSRTPLERRKTPLNSTGWIISGEYAKQDAGESYIFVKTSQDTIVTSGSRVWKSDLENILLTYPGVKTCMISVVQDPFSEERAVVSIEVDAKKGKVTQDELLKYIASKLALYKLPIRIELSGANQ